MTACKPSCSADSWTFNLFNQVIGSGFNNCDDSDNNYSCTDNYSCLQCTPMPEVKRIQRRVHFAKPVVTRILTFVPHTALSEEERSLAWYSRGDFHRFRESSKKECSMFDMEQMEIMWEDLLINVETQCNPTGFWWCNVLELEDEENDTNSVGSNTSISITSNDNDAPTGENTRSRSMDKIQISYASHSPTRKYKKRLLWRLTRKRKVDPLNVQMDVRRSNSQQSLYHSV